MSSPAACFVRAAQKKRCALFSCQGSARRGGARACTARGSWWRGARHRCSLQNKSTGRAGWCDGEAYHFGVEFGAIVLQGKREREIQEKKDRARATDSIGLSAPRPERTPQL
nr:hypothetical protein [Pandoravirus massiliensis]